MINGITDVNLDNQNTRGSIHLPSALFQNLPSTQNITTGLVFTLYVSPALFPIASASDIPQNRSIRSLVIGALVAGQDPVEDLIDPVLVNLTLSQDHDVRKQSVKLYENSIYLLIV